MSDVNALGTRLAEELAAAWQQGQRPQAEEFLDRHPELWNEPEAALPILYEEICQRQQRREPAATEMLLRFPRWQQQLEMLLECQRLLEPARQLPVAGDTSGDFRLLEEIGAGSRGRVFLATQSGLADRPMVVKFIPAEDLEHLSLGRLQHTHIVPLYSVVEDPERGLRALCMPYFGGTSLARILESLKSTPLSTRSGADLLRILDGIEAAAPVATCAAGPARSYLARASYVQTVCWLGACLADGLQHAHQRGLLHLDLKPANVLIAADGQPMLLDFHLARSPLRPGEPAPAWLGGTRGYMSPEQAMALEAVRRGQSIPVVVDGRSDLYSLGIVLFEMLTGVRPKPGSNVVRKIRRGNPGVSRGLAELLAGCLAERADERFADAGQVVTDLRRHLNDLPFQHVPNRHLSERWQKWRRRRPSALPMLIMVVMVAAALGFGAVGAKWYVERCRHQAVTALEDANRQVASGHYEDAQRTLERGCDAISSVPGMSELQDSLQTELNRVRSAQLLAKLHLVADQARLLYGSSQATDPAWDDLQRDCAILWKTREQLLHAATGMQQTSVADNVRLDLLDLAVLWIDWRLNQATDQGETLEILNQAEKLFGASPVLDEERSIARKKPARRSHRPHTAWEHYALGRLYLHRGDLASAASALQQAVTLAPDNLWANYYQGVCALRRRQYAEATAAFRVCVALAPEKAACYFNRALAWDGLGKDEKALADYSSALAKAPDMSAAALNRGILHYRHQRYQEAATDFERALATAADPAVVHYNLALVCVATKDRSGALAHLQEALRCRPNHAAARSLYDQLRAGR